MGDRRPTPAICRRRHGVNKRHRRHQSRALSPRHGPAGASACRRPPHDHRAASWLAGRLAPWFEPYVSRRSRRGRGRRALAMAKADANGAARISLRAIVDEELASAGQSSSLLVLTAAGTPNRRRPQIFHVGNRLAAWPGITGGMRPPAGADGGRAQLACGKESWNLSQVAKLCASQQAWPGAIGRRRYQRGRLIGRAATASANRRRAASVKRHISARHLATSSGRVGKSPGAAQHGAVDNRRCW